MASGKLFDNFRTSAGRLWQSWGKLLAISLEELNRVLWAARNKLAARQGSAFKKHKPPGMRTGPDRRLKQIRRINLKSELAVQSPFRSF